MKTTFENIKRDYFSGGHKMLDRKIGQFHYLPFEEAIRYSAGRRPGYKGKPRKGGLFSLHQNRIYNIVFDEMEKNLSLRALDFYGCHNFEEVLKIIYESRISGFADLCCYETAQRICVNLEIDLNTDKIYVHRGSYRGAKKLGIKIHSGPLGTYIERNDIPVEWKKLQSQYIEDFLCTYEHVFSTDGFIPKYFRSSIKNLECCSNKKEEIKSC